MIVQITGIRYNGNRYCLISGSRETEVEKDVMVFYLQRAKSDRNIKDYTVNDAGTTVTFAGPYVPVSLDDIGKLLRPTGVTGLLRELDSVTAEEAAK